MPIEFTAFMAAGGFSFWPPPSKYDFYNGPVPGGNLAYGFYPDGSLEVTVTPNDGCPAIYRRLQRIHIQGNGFVIVSFRCGNDGLDVWVNDLLLQDFPGGYDIPGFIAKPKESVGPRSVEDPEAIALCREFQERRRVEAQRSRADAVGRRRLTEEEQVAQLATAKQILIDSLQDILLGKESAAAVAAAQLRSLLRRERRSSPLLLRLAGAWDVPLAVYGFDPAPPDRPEVLDEATFHIQLPLASLHKKYGGMIVMDFEEFLQTPVQVIRSNEEIEQMTVIDLVSEIADTYGGAHYDEAITNQFDHLLTFNSSSWPLYVSLVAAVVDITISLCDFVIDTARGSEQVSNTDD